ncbi:hypothetical protein KI688_009724 [Linnemannia hyalina]|uniref:oligopeptidase A n=1 Tax=Linnemannia hyalina TaxID=64524 RepID=A0A9P7Y1D3_9FUNG|nr:hypothetical protein KI688_009724 [Linnemannia hyalina]
MLRSFTSSAASRLRATRLTTGVSSSTTATRAFSRSNVASHARSRTTSATSTTTLSLASRSLATRPLTIRRALATITDIKGATATYPKTNPEFTTNPILNWHTFPDFAAIKAEHVVPAVEILTKQIEATFQERSKRMTPTWEGTMGLTQDLEDDLERASGVISHFSRVKDSPEFRKAVEAIQPMIVTISLKMGQSLELYDALVKLADNKETWSTLDKEQKRIVQKAIQGMRLSGVAFGLPGDGNAEKQKRFNEIQGKLAQLSLTFSNNLQDETKAFAKVITDRKELEGCPESLMKAMAKNAQSRGHGDGNSETGPWAVTLDYPTYIPFMMNCKNRDLREHAYRAMVSRASKGEKNNEPVIDEILSLRQEEAGLLGFSSYGALSLSKKMASDVGTAKDILDRLYEATLPAAKKDLAELTEFAKDHLGHPTPLCPWDTPFVEEEYSKDRFKYSADQISEYLPYSRVMDTLFEVARDSFGIDVTEMSAGDQSKAGLTTWNKDVKIYQVKDDASKKVLAYFYGDFYSRSEEKLSGAWMDVCVTRMKDPVSGAVRVPIAYLVCNQPPPLSGAESLMKFQDVTTMFHEFGHGLQHMLTTVDYPQASGIKGVEWDFVEVASQFMENFAYEDKWLSRMAKHHKTGEPMPQEMKETVKKSKQCLAGMAMLRQLHFAMLDLELHTQYKPNSGETIFDVNRRQAKKTTLVTPIPEDRFLCGFGHIFGGGYAAGYYSYKFSELYSADAYAAFEEQGASVEGRKRIGRKYRDTVLAYGGATDPKEVWKEFRGRDGVEVDALLRHSGLLSSP